MLRKIYLTAMSLLVAVIFSVTTAHAATVFFEISGEDPTAGDLDLVFNTTTTEFSLDVYLLIGDDEDGDDGLYSAFHKIYINDDTILNFAEDGMTLNTALWDPSFSVLEVNETTGVGEIAITDYYDLEQPYGYLLLETITFTLTGETGTANLTMDFWDPVGGGNFILWPDGSVEIDDLISFNGATVTVNAVPIPGALLLLGSGLIGLMGVRRKVRG